MVRMVFGEGVVRGFAQLATVAGVCAASACFIELPKAKGEPCDRVACSADGYCELGKCFCEPGYVGDPYARHGCQPAPPEQACEAPCGQNAVCEGTECVCVDGFIAVCGTGDCLAHERLCDGQSDCANGADEASDVCSTEVTQTWIVRDTCDDGEDLRWRIWATERDWTWPGAQRTFATPGLDELGREVIACQAGETVCFGGEAGSRAWGVGLDGSYGCESCCVACEATTVDFGDAHCSDG